jgi:hypothetical protein
MRSPLTERPHSTGPGVQDVLNPCSQSKQAGKLLVPITKCNPTAKYSLTTPEPAEREEGCWAGVGGQQFSQVERAPAPCGGLRETAPGSRPRVPESLGLGDRARSLKF